MELENREFTKPSERANDNMKPDTAHSYQNRFSSNPLFGSSGNIFTKVKNQSDRIDDKE